MEVTAVVPHGAVLPTWFPAPLDGIIAAQARHDYLASRGIDPHGEYERPSREALAADPHGSLDPVVGVYRALTRGLPLPLAQLRDKRWVGRRWVWAASCATWDGDEVDVRHIHKRPFDAAAAGDLGATGIPANPDVTRWKGARIPVVAVVTDRLRWWALGDPRGVAQALAGVDAVGKYSRAGEGVVARWEVRDAGPPDLDRVRWHESGMVARPFPARAAGWLGLDSAEAITVDSYRPPYFRPLWENGKHTQQEVIAPWTTRPSSSTAA